MSIKTINRSSSRIVSHHHIAYILEDAQTAQKSLHAAKAFLPGEAIVQFAADSILSYPTYLTVQTGADMHITLSPGFLQYINHSCSPTVFFDTAAMQLTCLQPLQEEDEMTFFYPSTEWEMAQPFVCNCGSHDCIQLINGAAHLSVKTLSKYKLTDFIKQQVRQKLSL